MVKPLPYRDGITPEDLIKDLDLLLKIGMREYNKDLIDRVCDKYNLIPRSDVIFIIQNTFNTMRDLLLFGKILNLNGSLFGIKFKFLKSRKDLNSKSITLKIVLGTPKDLKNV